MTELAAPITEGDKDAIRQKMDGFYGSFTDAEWAALDAIDDDDESDWEEIGQVAVESGTIAIIDGCDNDAYDMEDVLGMSDYSADITAESGFAIGTLLRPGVGDGLYKVQGKIEDLPGWGRRLTQIKIDFMPTFEDYPSH